MGGPGSGRRKGGAGKSIRTASGGERKISKASAERMAVVNRRIAKKTAKEKANKSKGELIATAKKVASKAK